MENTEKHLPLNAEHISAGAAFATERGWRVPDHYGNTKAEESALASGVGLLDRSDRSVVDVTGADRISFLQGMLTNNIQDLSDGQGCRAALLNVKARVQMLMSVVAMTDRLRLILPPGAAAPLISKLDAFVITEDVDFTDRTGQFVALSLQGPRSVSALAHVTGRSPADLEGTFESNGVIRHESVTIGEIATHAIGNNELGSAGVDLWIDEAEGAALWSALDHVGAVLDLVKVGRRAANVRRIEAGIPIFGVDVDETTFLPDLPLDGLVSWTKGCYLGQEPVARTYHRGHAIRRLFGFWLPVGVQPPHSRVDLSLEGRVVGWISSAATSERLGRSVALGYLRSEVAEPGTQLLCEIGGVEHAVVAAAWPLDSSGPQEMT